MKKILSVLLLSLFINFGLQAEDLLPSDNYYKENIAVNDLGTNSPFTRDDGTGDPVGPDEDGESDGGAEWDGGKDSPIGDAILPISLIAIMYSAYIVLQKRKKTKVN